MNGPAARPRADLRDWLALSRAPGLGSLRCRRLLDRFGTPREILAAGLAAWSELGLPARTRDYLAAPDWRAVEADLRWLEENADRPACLTWDDPAYPPLLLEIPDPPVLLFVRGAVAALSGVQIAMVGSRSPTPAGPMTARDLARDLAGAGLAIVSGLAVGIDAACHEGALAAGGVTLAVCGTGPDRVYPRQHAALADRILAGGGALVTEYPPGTGPLAANFPRRNRIISGLALGVVVVEAAPRSGSLITARLALDQNRDVFAVPGSIQNPLARGCNQLIQQGAKLVQEAADILDEYRDRYIPGPRVTLLADAPEPFAGEPELLKYIAYEPTTVDTLVAATGSPADRIVASLLELELQGMIVSLPGGAFLRLR